jgi:uncharacterized protein (DUF1684 family)
MPTTSEEKRPFTRYAQVHFQLQGQSCNLTIFKALQGKGAGELFLPFKDYTSGTETYGAGRYLDIKIPADNQIDIDFNLAYNPYCAYSDEYSCPLPPKENFLKVRILAGEQVYKKH